MAILTFRYTKADGTGSNRVVIPLVVPADKYLTIDVSDLDIEDQVALARDIELLNAERTKKIDELMTEYDVRTNFRSFIPSRMTDIVEE